MAEFQTNFSSEAKTMRSPRVQSLESRVLGRRFSFFRLATRDSRLLGSNLGQATVELVLLVPLFLICAIGIIKIFALSVMVQKMELASYYAGRRWMLESHKNAAYASWDQRFLVRDIESKIAQFLGAGDPFKESLLGFKRQDIRFTVEPTIIYGVLTLNVHTKGLIPFRPELAKEWEIVKYVPTRDRPIRWNIPSLASQ